MTRESPLCGRDADIEQTSAAGPLMTRVRHREVTRASPLSGGNADMEQTSSKRR